MLFPFGSRIRHPFYPRLAPTPAVDADRPCIALYGTFRELERTAVPVRRAVFVVHSEGQRLLSTRERDLLWEKFQVPIFALLLDSSGRVIAYECEVQDGLHFDHSAATVSETEICDCGRPGRKLKLAS